MREQRVVPVGEIDPPSSEDDPQVEAKKKSDDGTDVKPRKRLDSFSSSSSFGSIRLTKKPYTRRRKRGTHRPKKSLRKKSAPLIRSVSVGGGDFAAALRAASATSQATPDAVAPKPRTKVVRAKKVEKAELLKVLASLDGDETSSKPAASVPKRKPTPAKDRKDAIPKPNGMEDVSVTPSSAPMSPPSPTKSTSKVLKKKRSSKEIKKADRIITSTPGTVPSAADGLLMRENTPSRLAALFVPPVAAPSAASSPASTTHVGVIMYVIFICHTLRDA